MTELDLMLGGRCPPDATASYRVEGARRRRLSAEWFRQAAQQDAVV